MHVWHSVILGLLWTRVTATPQVGVEPQGPQAVQAAQAIQAVRDQTNNWRKVLPFFDPDNLDVERANITCLGPLPNFLEPHYAHFTRDYRAFTLQELCAKVELGGKGPGQQLGGFCLPLGRGQSNRLIWFDHRPEGQISTELSNPRALQYCLDRCHCSQGLPVDARTVKPFHAEAREIVAGLHPALAGYQIKIDVPDDYSVPRDAHYGSGLEPLFSTGITYLTQQSRIFVQLINLHPRNRLRCNGPRPRWRLPVGQRSLDAFDGTFSSDLTNICAVHLAGGHPNANAGGYCHRNGRDSDVWFSDDMTPRLEWTWDNFMTSATIRFHCWRYCTCSNPPDPNNRTVARFWEFVPGFILMETPGGGVSAQPGSSSGPSTSGSSRSVPVLPPGPASGDRPAGTCGSDGQQFCDMPWPSDVFGPKPVSPPSVRVTTTATSTAARPAQCAAQCVRNGDCRGIGAPDGCRCVAASVEEARAQGSDPVFPRALCLLVVQAAVHHRPGAAKPGVRGRSVAEATARDDSRGWACACNTTYVSEACCHADTGLVWEPLARKLGRLADL
ncbi:MAG: hypothetical protein M1817_005753 [Caeruleum heppii]|nr:MAG: hypothetical protein M1817_005753 [Caeruleum heppii]